MKAYMATSTTARAASSIDNGTMRLCVGLLMLFGVIAGQGAISLARSGSLFPAWLMSTQTEQPVAATHRDFSKSMADSSSRAG